MFDLDFSFGCEPRGESVLGFKAGLIRCNLAWPLLQSWGKLVAAVPLGTGDAASSEVAVSASEEANGLRQAGIWFFGLSSRRCCPCCAKIVIGVPVV